MPKILIIRFSSIGDIVLTTPVVRCLKEQVKDIEIHYLTKTTFKGILEHNPYIDKVFSFNQDINEILPSLKAERHDQLIDLHHNLRSYRVKTTLREPGHSVDKLNFEKWLMVNFKINRLPDVHIVDRYLETVKSLGVENDNKGLDYFIPETDEVDITSLPDAFHSGYIGFVIGAKHYTKQLPAEKIVSIIQKIKSPVVLLGGKEDEQKGNEIVKAIQGSVYNACGKYNLNQSASLVKQANKIITHDTGLMHIAAAFKKDIISLWGNTIPEFGMYPYLPGENSKIIEVKGLSCRPCSKIGHEKCPKKHFRCMLDIMDEEVIAALGE